AGAATRSISGRSWRCARRTEPSAEARRFGVLFAFELRDIALHGAHHRLRHIDEQAADAAYGLAVGERDFLRIADLQCRHHERTAGQVDAAILVDAAYGRIEQFLFVEYRNPAAADVLQGHHDR